MKRHKILKELLISVASLALIAPLGLSSIQSASANHYLSYAEISAIENKADKEADLAVRAQNKKYRPILRGYHGNMEEAHYDLDGYYDALKHAPWVLDDLGRRSRVSPRWWINHGGYEGISEGNDILRNATHKPKGYHGPNSLRGVPFTHHKHARHRHARKHIRRNRRHVSRRHNHKHKVNQHRHGRRHGRRNHRRNRR